MWHSRKWFLSQGMSKKARIGAYISSFSILAALTGVIIWRLYTVQVVDNELYLSLARQQQLKDEPITATRGNIYDNTGNVLVTSSVVWDIAADPRSSIGLWTEQETPDSETGEIVITRILKPQVCAEVSAGLARILVANDGSDGMLVDVTSAKYIETYEMIYENLSMVDSYYKSLAKGVSLNVREAIVLYMQNFNEAYEDGVVLITTTQTIEREYPYGDFAASVLGFCDADGFGVYGLERQYEELLAGTDGRITSVQNVFGDEVAQGTINSYEPQEGQNISLYMDVYVQSVVEHYLEEAIAANDVENRGAAIVMDVNTGGIIAMASKPDFDPNDPYTPYDLNYLEQMILEEPEIYGQYVKDEEGNTVLDEYGVPVLDLEADYSGTYRDLQWKNKTITELYYPGSIFKMFTAAMALDSNLANINLSYTCTGSHVVAGTRYGCAGGAVHGTISMPEAVRSSCNIYFIQLAEAMGAETFYDYFNGFGFTSPTGVDLPYETNYIQYYDLDNLGPVELASSAFGQSMAITPLQLCTAMASIVNGGYLVTPQMVKEVTDINGNVVYETQSEVLRQVISESTSETIRYLLEYEVGYGTETRGGFRAYVAGYRIGGKSGTSEQLNMDLRISDGDYKKVSSYVAVIPANDPQYLIYMMLDDPNNPDTDYASALVAPAIGNIISEIAPYLGVETDGTDLSGTTVKVPNIVGSTWSTGQVSLNRIGLKHNLVESETLDETAAIITYQYPSAGTEVLSGTTVYTYIEGTSGQTAIMPDVTGKTVTFAKQLLQAAGFNVSVVGDENLLVSSQSIAPEQVTEKGTIVTIICEGESG